MTRLLRHIVHYAIYLVAAVGILLSLVALMLRFWILPDVDRYRPDLEQYLSQATGLPVSIGAIQAGWQGLTPYLRIDGLRLLPPQELPCLSLPRVDAKFSWTSLVWAEPRLTSLELHQPHVVIRRDDQGALYVAGIPVNTPGGESAFPDWLLRQRLIVVRQGAVVWRDETLDAPPLTLSDLDLVLYNRFGRHRLAVIARPPPIAASKLDLRADFKGRSVHLPQDFQGRVYARLDGASAQALRTWAPWAQEAVQSGQGTLRFWLDFAQRQATAVVGDVHLREVRLNLAPELGEIGFRELNGRIGWRRDQAGQVYTVEHLSFVSPSGQRAEPATVKVRLQPAATGKLAAARVETEDLRLEALTALAGAVPLPRAAHDLIERHNPHGHIDRLRLDWQDAAHYELQASFREVGIKHADGVPGFSGLSGVINASQKGGRARLHSKHLWLDYPEVWRNTLSFDLAQVNATWETGKAGEYAIEFDDLRLFNADLDGTSRGRVTLRRGRAPDVDISAHLRRGEGNAVWRYLPWEIADDAYHWIQRSIMSGVSPDTRLTLRGPLDRFPFDQGGGLFRVDVKLKDVVVQFGDDWPAITGINGWLIFHDKAMEILADRGESLGMSLQGIRGVVADVHHPGDKTLNIAGQARGGTAGMLNYIRHSPVYDYTNRFTAAMSAQGNSTLQLHLSLPLRDIDATQVSGALLIEDNRLDTGKGLPPLEHLSGRLAFTHKHIKGQGITTTIFGQPATLEVESLPGGEVKVALAGRATPHSLAAWVPQTLLRQLSGSAGYRAEIGLSAGQEEVRISSDLRGLAVDLPEPFRKTAEQPVPLLLSSQSPGRPKIDLAPVGGGSDRRAEPGAQPTQALQAGGGGSLQIRYGQLLHAHILPGEGAAPARVGVRIGQGDAAAPKDIGLSLTASLPRIDLDAWEALWSRGGGAPGKLPIHTVTLTANELVYARRMLRDIHLTARPAAPGWRIQADGREVQGEVLWQEQDGIPRLQGRLQRLALPETLPGVQPAAPMRIPVLNADVTVDSFSHNGKDWGALSLQAVPDPLGLRVADLSLKSKEGQLHAAGLLTNQPRRQSRFQVQADSANLGKLLERLGQADRIKGGTAQVRGQLGWQGGLAEFGLANLSGDLQLTLKNGQFSKLDPGAARLLGILSLQALPRRINLDMRDIFSEGFAFDEITTPLHLDRGVVYLADLRMTGPAAGVRMKGSIDLARETQSLRLTVQPRLDDTVAAGALLVNPVIGLGVFAASKVLKDPIGKAVSFEYLVEGGWAEPVVKRIARTPTSPE